MSFAETLKTEAAITSTLNGAKTYSTTNDACLDLFSVAGGMRGARYAEQIRLFDRAYIENPELAMKLLFYIRDIRGGLGEREFFRTLIRHVAKVWPASAKKNVRLISEYGRFDDLMCLMGTSAQKEVITVISSQLKEDLDALHARTNGNPDAHISLLAKWLPSINTSSARTRGQAEVLVKALGMNKGSYRKCLASLRRAISLTECRLTENKVNKINYSAVPAGAMLKYRGAFLRKDEERLRGHLELVSDGKAKMHTDTLYPYQLVRPYIKRYSNLLPLEVDGEEVLDALWNNQSSEVSGKNAISVIDVSGSMYLNYNSAVLPAHLSQSLGLYYAERCSGTFHNMFITFESEPHLIEIHGETLADKLRYISTAPWGGSTNLEAVFDLILRTAMQDHTPQNEMPATIYIISDMEFNMATRNADLTVYDSAKTAYEAAGYELPTVVFHNVNSWQMQAPVRAHTRGAALVSGAGTDSFKYEFDKNITPMSHMLRVLNGPRYAAVHA